MVVKVGDASDVCFILKQKSFFLYLRTTYDENGISLIQSPAYNSKPHCFHLTVHWLVGWLVHQLVGRFIR